MTGFLGIEVAMIRRFAIGLVLAGLAQSSASAVSPIAVLKGPKTAAVGELITLDAGESLGDRFEWKPAEAYKGFFVDSSRKTAVFVSATSGVFAFGFAAAGVDDAGKLEIAISWHVVRVGGGEPTPSPSPGPSPIPTPPTPVPNPLPSPQPIPPLSTSEALGRSYAAALRESYAKTWEQSADLLQAGQGTKESLMKDFGGRWLALRTPAYVPIAEEFAKLVPDDREPTAGEMGFLVKAWRDFAKGLRANP